MQRYFFVFDVESVGLHGEGFMVGWVVLDTDGAGRYAEFGSAECPASAAAHATGSTAKHETADRAWVAEHVTSAPGAHAVRASSPRAVRDAFWEAWTRAQARYSGIVMAADVPIPVEANFVRACMLDNLNRSSPYPFIDVASVLLASGQDPLATFPRQSDELPQHTALADARQSARLLYAALAGGR